MADIFYQTIRSLSEKLGKREITSREITEAYLGRIEKHDRDINSFITVGREIALKNAEEADKRIAAGEKGPLLGVPLAIKDLINIEGVVTTCASKILENFRSPYSAFVIKQLEQAGAVFLGKTNMDEFAMGSSNETSHFGVCKNPWDLKAVPGGSSGGSAAAVAAGFCPGSLGSDTGGSIRQPAALCGIVGLKPTYGRVSRFGLVAFASSLDQIGPMSHTVEDSATILQAIAGFDPMDSTSVNLPVPDYSESLNKGVKGMVIGIPKEYLIEGTDAEALAAVKGAASRLESEGARIEEISLPHTEYAIPVYYVIAPAEASSNLSRYDGVKYGYRSKNGENLAEMYINSRTEGFGTEVKRRIMVGTYALSSGYYDAYYIKAQKVRTLITEDFTKAFGKCDIILTPTTPSPAFNIGEKTSDPLEMYLSDIFTVSANLAGIPGITIPAGFSSKNGRPLGVQMLANHWGEPALFTAASAYEKLRDPSISAKTPTL
ncbi:MAG: Asp-tRNA(Asn)/Glu-tRNA(Gln) amidotransferase subunit GatA [Nitrospinota bacterium]|nr:Asp-tRNA(Asn)/Glu-tRNA(Gln) amidotransferase subunit GatA [Nitrospinota bacterium]